MLNIDIPVYLAGAFAFYTTFSPLPDLSTSGKASPSPTKTATFYIDIAPKLSLKNDPLPQDALSIFSVISKFMGDFPTDWERHLKGIGQRNYNMVHFTPLMARGNSNSPYSIYDQLRFNPESFPNGEKDVAAMVKTMENEHGLLGLTDVVWNHTANNSKWLEEHPEVGYNIDTAPWLESALELDSALLKYGEELENYGLPTVINNMSDLHDIMSGAKKHVLDALKLWEYYIVDVEHDAQAIVDSWERGMMSSVDSELKGFTLKQQAEFLLNNDFIGKKEFRARFHRKTNPQVGAALLTSILNPHKSKDQSTSTRTAALHDIEKILNELNLQFYKAYDNDAAVVIDQVLNRVKYLRLDDNGPKLGPISEKHPLIETYFTRLPINATTRKHSPGSLALVNNGWIWAADAMKDHAGPDSRAYLRREVIVWSDCVKLRYGKSPEENPILWDYMTKYTRLMAKYFAGFRIDNCHSTPLAVAEYLLDQAREIRPNLAVFAELFTGSEKMDYVFVERLGLSALIREAMQAWSTGELSRLVHMHGGRPIGSFEVDEAYNGVTSTSYSSQSNGIKKAENVHRIKQTPVHALFMDCTHDNEVPAQKRDARDTLPNATLVNMCASATGSVMGYDEIYPKLVGLVHETRQYASPFSEHEVKIGGGKDGFGGIKKLLNQIHALMGKEGYDETHIHHEGEHITVHRIHPKSRKGYFAIAHTAFPGYGEGEGSGALSPVHLVGTKAKLLGSWRLDVDTRETTKAAVLADKEFLRGLPSEIVDLPGVDIDTEDTNTTLRIPAQFPPGSIALFETWIPGAEHSRSLESYLTNGAQEAFDRLSLVDLNFVLYRCEEEERDSSGGKDGVYVIPNHGPLVYAGLQGWWSILRDVIRNNDLGHPLCNHLRDGQWALDYTVTRLGNRAKRDNSSALSQSSTWLLERFSAIRRAPNFLLPRLFAMVIQTAYTAMWNRALELMSSDIRNGQPFLQSLAMVSIQQTGYVRSASLYPSKQVPCISAGLPHFSTDWARCWGRDVFLSIRGLYLATGRFAEAKEHIMAFASVLKHGMVPNLLSSGKSPRYNARDAVWFFLQNIQDYTKLVPDGLSLLAQNVSRRFLPYDDTYFEFDDSRAYSKESTIEGIVYEALQRHASGLSFREANAGPTLDMQMKPEGFQIDVHVDWDTGIIFGGNQFNCGTWMDKMGESEKAGSKGIPGTPRDGAAIEITGLLYSTLVWVAQLHREGKFNYSGVKISEDREISFRDWAFRLEKNFERCYYVPIDPQDDAQFQVNPTIVNRRGIYKDLYRSGKEYEDYQLRPNFPIAMTVAPQLFTSTKALYALKVADDVLRGPTGMATLDPSDLNYNPYYNNSEDSTSFATSKGRNYHQGPEWLWPTGFFLRALLKFDLMQRTTDEGRTEAFQQITRRLAGCKRAIRESPWAGLTELTNKNGELCGDSVSVSLFFKYEKQLIFVVSNASMVCCVLGRFIPRRQTAFNRRMSQHLQLQKPKTYCLNDNQLRRCKAISVRHEILWFFHLFIPNLCPIDQRKSRKHNYHCSFF